MPTLTGPVQSGHRTTERGARGAGRSGSSPRMADRRDREANGRNLKNVDATGEPAGNADIARLRRPAAPALTLPRFAPEIPTAYRTEADSDALFTITEGLLAERILQEEDWDAEAGFPASLNAGLQRFTEDMGARDLEYFPLKLVYTNEVGHFELLDYPNRKRPDGGFALIGDTTIRVAEVGQSLLRIEGLAKGAGYALMALLQSALHCVRGWTPQWAYSDLENTIENEYDHQDEKGDWKLPEDYEGLTLEEFLVTCPEKAVFPQWNQRAYNRAVKHAPAERDSRETMALYLADSLREAMDMWKRECGDRYERNQISESEWPSCPCVILRWAENDEVGRLFDDYAEMILQADYTEAVWLQCFDMNVESVRQAARHLQHVMRVICRADALMSVLDCREEQRERVMVTV